MVRLAQLETINRRVRESCCRHCQFSEGPIRTSLARIDLQGSGRPPTKIGRALLGWPLFSPIKRKHIRRIKGISNLLSQR